MSKVSLNYRDKHGISRLTTEQAAEFFLGCSDAFVEMGLLEIAQRLVDIIEVVRIYACPSTPILMTVEVVTCWDNQKRKEYFTVYVGDEETSKEDIRESVRIGIVQKAKSLVRTYLQDFQNRMHGLPELLGLQ